MFGLLTEEDREEAIYVLKQRLRPKDLRDVIDRNIEKLVVTTEHNRGLYQSRLNDADLAAFLIDTAGIDLLVNRDLRSLLVRTLPPEQVTALISWNGDEIPRSREDRIEKVAHRKWTPGKLWATHFATTFGFPNIFAGIAGIPSGPAIEEIEPHIPLSPLHDYQQELVQKIISTVQSPPGDNRAILSLPTGAGKTRTVVEALLTWWGKDENVRPYIVWIAQSDELCEQAVQAFREVWVDRGGKGPKKILRLFRYWGNNGALPEAFSEGVVVASIQKLHKLYQSDLGPEDLARIAHDTAVIVVDEAHRATASSYTAVLNTFGISFGHRASSSIPLIGLTATPYRGVSAEENRRLASRFHFRLLVPECLGKDPIGALRKKDILSDVDHQVLETKNSFSLTPQEQQHFDLFKDFPESFLGKVAANPQRNTLLVGKLLELPPTWPVLCFGCSVDHARAIAILLRRAGRNAEVVTGETRPATRRYLIEAFRAHQIQILCNYGVLTTGFDAPQVRAVVIARPTTSVVLYEQMIGRGMRGPVNGGTSKCTVIDLQDNIDQFQEQMAYTRMREFWL